ncbi:uncharacterized protein LOC129950379 [Eupeodes corollae]|uniref:uncharacterized protein LOC129950379 n=1 Tax=Eupeodes corollae TaxID=290404 RepID=UPI00249043C6|nr:uncharacterized protein LOC129950379 [Eupeodes corollae]
MKKLTLKKKYAIVGAKKCTTRYGQQLCLELNDCYVFLPKRCAESFGEEEIRELPKLCLEVVAPHEATFEIDFHEKESSTSDDSNINNNNSINESSSSSNEEERFEIIDEMVTRIKRFGLNGRKIQFKIKPVPENKEPTSWIREGLNGMFKHALKDLDPLDKVGITFSGKSFSTERGSGWINFKDCSAIKFSDIWEMVSRIFQSNSTGLSTDDFNLSITSVKLPSGSGRKRSIIHNTFEKECSKRKGIVSVHNTDNLCLPRALVVGKVYANKESVLNKNAIRRDIGKIQTKNALKLINEAHINIPPEGCGIPELKIFQQHLKEYKITVYNHGTKGRDIIFEGDNDEKKKINLIYHNNHFNLITSLTAAFCCSYYCEDCHEPYNMKSKHRCHKTCPQCQNTPPCPKIAKEINCVDCNRNFRGKNCFDKHKAGNSKGNNICEQVKRCILCLKTYSGNRTHICGEYYCKLCRKHVEADHLCYILPDSRLPSCKDTLYIFYDLESRQERVIGEKIISIADDTYNTQVKIHEPNLCVFRQKCYECFDIPNLAFCNKCGHSLNVVQESEEEEEEGNIIPKFLKHILNVRQKFKNVIVLAHNGQSYDHQFILNYILNETNLSPELIMRGSKIILMIIGNIKFIDSLNYFPMALSKLPKTFQLSSELKKGYFPHLFNTRGNRNYVGKLPALEFYSPNTMKTEELEVFLKWYGEHKNDIFELQRELLEYCISDVNILTEACLKFRRFFLIESNIEPFLEATTIASSCNLVYRRNFLQSNTIGLIPKNGYRCVDNQSTEAIKWLILEEQSRKINIKHAAKGREAIINGVKVDGFCEENKQVFEFHGCYYHGHPACLKHKRDEPLSDKEQHDTLNYRYERTLAKTARLRSFNYEVIEKWSCEFETQLSFLKDEELNFINNHPLVQNAPLNPRDGFFGGRTGNTFNYYKCKEGEQIKYIDVCSLYPWVCKNGKFPVGHPKVHTSNDDICSNMQLDGINGLIKCKILPPENLFHPVLPQKQNNKLMFSLCRTCSSEKTKERVCTHSDDQRALLGTWVIDEVVKAIEMGYKLLTIMEIWEYDVIQYNPTAGTEGLFTSMMNKYLKIKQEASGWPNICLSEEDKNKYITDFLEKEKIKLEYSEITDNPGKRSLAKLILNSFWGKFGQRENQQKTCIINNPSDLFNLLTHPSIEVSQILPINENNIVISFEMKEEAVETLSTVNVSIAAYTTTQARLKLYSYLEKLQERVLYYDTDSVIYVCRQGEFDPPTGDFIGDMTNELDCYGQGSYITEFVSGGPKNYSYKVYSTKDKKEHTVCKVKGIFLNYESSQKINFDSIKEAVLNSSIQEDSEESIVIKSKNIRRTIEHQVVTVEEVKTYKPRAEKRQFFDDHSSLPYGYKRKKPSPPSSSL